MARIYKRDRVWYLDIRVNGRRLRRRVGTSKKIAELALKDAEVKVARHEFGFARKDVTLDKLFSLFLEYSGAHHRPGSTNRFRAIIDNFNRFIHAKGNITFLSEITTELIDQYKIYRKTPQSRNSRVPTKGITAETVNYELKTLTNIFNRAISWGYLTDNPIKNVTRLKVDKAKSVRFLSLEECQRLLKASPEDMYPILFTYLSTGMRKSELIHLEWTDIDFKRKVISIQWKDFWQPKSGKRDIPIAKPLFKLLQELRRKNMKGIRSNFVFPHKDGGATKTKLREKLVEIAEDAGIENLTKLHTLRHTFASHLVMSGVDLPTVKNLMGHSDIQTTMIYAHLAPDHLAGAVDKLEF